MSDFNIGDKVILTDMDGDIGRSGTVTNVIKHKNDRVSYDVDFPDYLLLGERFASHEIEPFITVLENK